jgi:hypothetical protein
MPPKKKTAPTPAPSNHEAQVEAYKSAMLNTTLYEPWCSCGWSLPRYFKESQAEAEVKRHLENVG